MSHFTVLVHLTDDEVSNNIENIKELVSEKLQPYHEFECTGNKDQYVVKVDCTDEKLHDYNNDSVEAVYDAAGALVGSKYSTKCEKYWVRTGYGYSSSSEDKFILPEGYELRNTPLKDIYTFTEYLTDWCGYDMDGKYSLLEDGRFYTFTNPNAKWDWWTIGGRWDGMFLGHDGHTHNIIKKKNWDIATVTTNIINKYEPFYDRFEQNAHKFEGLEFISWSECCEKFKNENGFTDYSKCRDFFNSQEYINVLQGLFNEPGDEEYQWTLHSAENFFNVSREAFLKARIYGKIGMFAVLDASGWHEKGSMGWFACVSDEKAQWNQIYLDKLNSIPENDYLVVVDCHI